MAAIERLPATGRTQHCGEHGEYLLLGYMEQDLDLNIGMLEKAARRIDISVFNMERQDAASDVAYNLNNGGSLVIATLGGEAIGYSSHQVFAPIIDGSSKRIMLTTTRAFIKEHQGKGLAPDSLRMAFTMHRAPDIVAGITGMAPAVAAYYDSHVIAGSEPCEANVECDGLARFRAERSRVKLYPFYRPYKESESMQAGLDYVVARTRYRHQRLNRDTGLMLGLFDKDSSKLFDPNKTTPRVDAISAIMRDEFGCDPSEGSAMIVMGVKQGWTRFMD